MSVYPTSSSREDAILDYAQQKHNVAEKTKAPTWFHVITLGVYSAERNDDEYNADFTAALVKWVNEASEGEKKARMDAASRILKVHELGSKTLDLSGLGLTSLPPKMDRLKSLAVLNVNHNRLTKLPTKLFKRTHRNCNRDTFIKLSELHASHNLLTKESDWGFIRSCKKVDLSFNQLKSLTWKSKVDGQEVDLRGNPLQSLTVEHSSKGYIGKFDLRGVPSLVITYTLMNSINNSSGRREFIYTHINEHIIYSTGNRTEAARTLDRVSRVKLTDTKPMDPTAPEVTDKKIAIYTAPVVDRDPTPVEEASLSSLKKPDESETSASPVREEASSPKPTPPSTPDLTKWAVKSEGKQSVSTMATLALIEIE